MKQSKTGLMNFVIFPRQIVQDRRNGLLKMAEFYVYTWVRLNASPYGVAIISLSDIRNDIYDGEVSENYINKLLLSLKSKKYIYYQRRAGRRGSFEVHFGDWILPNKTIKTLDKYFNPEVVRGSDIPQTPNLSEPSQNNEVKSQNFNELKILASSMSSDKSLNNKIRASYNDIDNYKKNDTNCTQSFSLNRNVKPQDFTPETYEQQRCREIAEALGEKSMKFILSALDRYQFHKIEKAWIIYQDEKVGKNIGNPGAYFNDILSRTIEKDSQSNQKI